MTGVPAVRPLGREAKAPTTSVAARARVARPTKARGDTPARAPSCVVTDRGLAAAARVARAETHAPRRGKTAVAVDRPVASGAGAAAPRTAPRTDGAPALNDVDMLRDVRVPTWLGYNAEQRWPTLPSYGGMFTKQAGLPDIRPRRTGNIPADAPFAPAVIETCDPSLLRDYMPESDWRVVEVLVDPAAFTARVLRPDWRKEVPRAAATVHPVRLTKAQWNDLLRKGYIRLRKGSATLPCSVFAVMKSDGIHLRLIWNGVPFNGICNPPPAFTITRLDLMLAKLLHPRVKWFYAFDFQTWFVQLKCHPHVASFFTTRHPDGSIYDVVGVPMGWSWACACAHTLTAAVTRAILEDLGCEPDDVVAEFCIDNVILGVTSDDITPEMISASVERVTRRFGIRVKASATEHGTSVDWLMWRLDATSRTAVFKPAYVDRLNTAAARARKGDRAAGTTLIEVWAIAGLIIFSTYAAGRSLTQIAPVLHWMARHSPPPNAPPEHWKVPLDEGFPHWRLIWDAAKLLAGVEVTPRPLPESPPVAWAITDSAGGRGNNATLVFTPRWTYLNIYQCRSDGIADRELCASTHALGVMADYIEGEQPAVGAGATPTQRSIYVFTDNEVARAALDRGFSLCAESESLRIEVEDKIRGLRGGAVHVAARRVDTRRCVADAWTRLDPSGNRVPTSTRRWERTCGHEFEVTRICACDRARFATTNVDLAVLDRWCDDPPRWRPQSSSMTSWYQGMICQ